MTAEKDKEKWPYQDIAQKVVLGVVGIWGLSAIAIVIGAGSDSDAMGLAGDGFGAINSLFSGLAFAGLIYAILLQRDELKAQRDELEMTRDVLKEQKVALEKQNETFLKQTFENTLFHMISLHNEMFGKSAKEKLQGLFQDMKRGYDNRNNAMIVPRYETPKVAYDAIYKGHSNFLAGYFRSLYRIFKYIDESDVKDKGLYTDIVRSHFSDQELFMLFYNAGMTDKGKKFKTYIERYELLDNLPAGKLLHPSDDISLFDESAYGYKNPLNA